VRRDRLLKLAEVEELTALKKTTVYMLMKRDEFPRCVQVTSKAVAWVEAEVLQWVQDRIAAARNNSTP
jgi:prophage regulatory protein